MNYLSLCTNSTYLVIFNGQPDIMHTLSFIYPTGLNYIMFAHNI